TASGLRVPFLAVVLAAALPAAAGEKSGSREPGAFRFAADFLPFLERYCTGCHGGKKKKAGLELDAYRDISTIQKDRQVWEKVLHMLLEHEMPPEEKRQPPEARRTQVTDWLRGELAKFDCSEVRDSGRVTLRRLNRAEYNNTVRDLLGVKVRPADAFPADDTGYGFDNIGDVLSVSPLLMEKYLEAAQEVAAEAVGEVPRFHRRFEAERLEASAPSRVLGVHARSIDREGEVAARVKLPETGLYLLRVRAYGEQAGPEFTRLGLRIDDRSSAEFEVRARDDAPRVYEVQRRLEAGERRLAVAYLNNYNEPDHPDPKLRGDRNLVVDYFEVQLLDRSPEGRSAQDRVFSSRPDEKKSWDTCAAEILTGLARRAYRRPTEEREVKRLVELARQAIDDGDSFGGAIRFALEGLLASPHFIFRVEIDAEPDDPGSIHRVGSYELASRLSYFLWSSLPDDELFELAAKDSLHDEKTLESQVVRMLKDPKSRALIDNFAGQWLQLRFLDSISPDPELFPQFDDALRQAMRTETLKFFEAIVREDRSVLEFLDADFTFVNARLARHYGFEDFEEVDGTRPQGGAPEDGGENVRGKVDEDGFRKVRLDGARGGLLTQASVLTLTSNPTRTSPVKRGQWILDRILGTPPPPPPPDVEELPEDPAAILSGSLRQRMEKHREDPGCASCHDRMDPLGFAFENFDAVGKWREFDGQFLIDPAGTLPDGTTFDGPEGLKKVLIERRALFLKALSEKMLTYALGRGLEYYDRCAVEEVAEHVAANGHRFSSLVLGLVKTRPFLLRRGDPTEP
ncbi:MAG: DUF1592 domain-containing protein, partial [Planctomycetota bacterium]|nr:DUF1592 domain-containing protein [Planctomycetota bacterium]